MDGRLVFFCLWMCVYQDAVGAITTTCDTEPVTAGGKAAVTCHFGTDVKSQGHVVLLHHRSSIQEVVMHCYWPDDRGQGYTCVTYGNFTRITDVTETVTVALPNAQKDAEGLYYCEVVDDEYSYATCNLSIAGDSTMERENPKPSVEESIWFRMGPGIAVVGGIGVSALLVTGTLIFLKNRKAKTKAVGYPTQCTDRRV